MDEAKVYDKLEQLAVSQASMAVSQKQIIEHLETTNGNAEKLREDFDKKSVEDAHEKGKMEGTLGTLRFLIASAGAAIAASGTAAAIVFGVLKFLEG